MVMLRGHASQPVAEMSKAAQRIRLVKGMANSETSILLASRR